MDKKICPVCGEEISVTARKCPYCNEWIDTSEVQSASSNVKTNAHTSITTDATTESLTYSKTLVVIFAFLALIGIGSSIFGEILPIKDEFDESAANIAIKIGTILEAVGMFSMLLMYSRKITSDGIKEVSGGLVLTTAILSAAFNLMTIADNDGILVLSLIVGIINQICWIIVGVQSIKVKRLRKIGIWMIVANVLSGAVLTMILFSYVGAKVSDTLIAVAFLCLVGYGKMFDNLQDYLCPKEVEEYDEVLEEYLRSKE